jgi:hypothetical protein
MRKLATLAAAASLVAGGVGLSIAAPAAADQDSSPWIRFHQADFTVAAGSGCSFQVDAHVVNDKEEFQNVDFYDDGTVKTQIFKGLLVIAFTNHDTGTSLTRNVNGRAFIDYTAAGEFERIRTLTGHFTTAVAPGNELPAGVYYVGGQGTSMTINDDGTKTFVFGPNGSAENLCPELAG